MTPKVSILKNIEIFQHLSEEALLALSEICEPLSVSKKKKLAEPGKIFNQLFIIRKGLIRWYFYDEFGNFPKSVSTFLYEFHRWILVVLRVQTFPLILVLFQFFWCILL